jgi:hypothetical protein
MPRKCSICREKGHDKRQCPTKKKEKEEKIKIQRDRLNVILPIILGSPYLAGFLWYLLSKDNPEMSRVNYAILAGDIVGLNVPEGATLGALMTEGTTIPEKLNKAKSVIEEAGQTHRRGVQESGYSAGRAFAQFIEQIKFVFAEEYREPNGEESEGWSGFTGGSREN